MWRGEDVDSIVGNVHKLQSFMVRLIIRYVLNISRVTDQNGISRLCIIVKIHHFGWKPSIYS